MAPKGKRTHGNNPSSAEVPAATGRVTRSVSRRDNANLPPVSADPELSKRKKAKTTPTTSAAAGADPLMTPAENKPEGKIIVIEHCKQCNSFKTRAFQVKNGLEKSVVGVNVVVNPEKPRKGCFEIREEGGERFVSLLDMKRPFRPMKDLDMEKVISDIVEKIK